MSRYFFHIRNGDQLEIDDQGTEFPSKECAVSDARIAAREMIAALLLSGEAFDGRQFEITTEDGSIVDTVEFRSVLNLL